MSFADQRNVDNIMDEPPHSAVTMVADADHDAAHKAPLLSSADFDFQQYQYKSLSLAQHIVVYLRLKVMPSVPVPHPSSTFRARLFVNTQSHTSLPRLS
jgi:hypothetical protein